jgi:hypothetical protein
MSVLISNKEISVRSSFHNGGAKLALAFSLRISRLDCTTCESVLRVAYLCWSSADLKCRNSSTVELISCRLDKSTRFALACFHV